jgi:hypothetical protein
MIRANLLPRPNDRIRFFGANLSVDVLRACALGLLALILVALAGRALEFYREVDLTARARTDEAQLSRNGIERERLRALSARVGTLRAIDKVAVAATRSGNEAALAVVRLGNALPGDVWLDDLTRTGQEFRVSGRSTTLARVGLTVASLGRALPGREARLLGVEGRSEQSLHFSAVLRDEAQP